MLDTTQGEVGRRFSDMKFSPDRQQGYSQSKRNNLQSQKYFCHYQNAVYMGGMDCFKRNGFGIVLMDSGGCALTSHSHDSMVQHNVIFRDRSLTSMVVKSNKEKLICYRSGPYLLSMQCSQLSRMGVVGVRPLVGKGFFVNFLENKVYKINIDGAQVEKKLEIKDKSITYRIFHDNNYSDIISDQQQIDAMNLKFNLPKQIKYIKNGKNLTIGFAERDKRTQKIHPCGLVFRLSIDTSKQNFDVALLERGYFQGQKMENFGQRHFQNQNYYVGGFRNGVFHGQGVLITPEHQQWTMCTYRNGEPESILESSVNSNLKINEIVMKLHSCQQSYIKHKMKLSPNERELRNVLHSVVQMKTQAEIESQQQLQKKRKQNLKTINDDYVSGHYQKRTEQLIKQQLSQSRRKLKKSLDTQLSIPPQKPRISPKTREVANQPVFSTEKQKVSPKAKDQIKESVLAEQKNKISPKIQYQPKRDNLCNRYYQNYKKQMQQKNQKNSNSIHGNKYQYEFNETPVKTQKKKEKQQNKVPKNRKIKKTFQYSLAHSNPNQDNQTDQKNRETRSTIKKTFSPNYFVLDKYNLNQSNQSPTPTKKYNYKFTDDQLGVYPRNFPHDGPQRNQYLQSSRKKYQDQIAISRQRLYKYGQDDQLRMPYGRNRHMERALTVTFSPERKLF